MAISKLLIVVSLILLSSTFSRLEAQRHYEKSLEYFNSGNTTTALIEIDKALDEKPNNIENLALRAYFYLSKNDKKAATADYDRMLNIDPKNEIALTNRGLIYMEMENYEAAMTDLNELVKLHPENWDAYYERAYCLALTGNHEDAIRDFSEAIDINPHASEAYANRGFSKINMVTANGILSPSFKVLDDACTDLRQAQQMGDTTVIKSIAKYCQSQ